MNEKCTIMGCNREGVQRYDLFNDKPHFMTSLLCRKHSIEANKELDKRGLKVNKDGTFKMKNKTNKEEKNLPPRISLDLSQKN